MNLGKVDEIANEYDCQGSWLVMVLQDVQEEYNYLPASALERVAAKLDVPLSRVYNVTTFYSSFSLTERGRHLIKVCDGTACHLRGSLNLQEEVTRQLGIKQGQTTEDKLFTLELVACLGACALAPVMTVGSNYHCQMTPEKLRQTLAEYRNDSQSETQSRK